MPQSLFSNNNLPLVFARFLFVFVAFFPFVGDPICFPFRLLLSNQDSIDGTWIGTAQTSPLKTAASADLTDLRRGKRIAAIRLYLRPVIMPTVPEGWHLSSELAGSLEVHFVDGTQEHCPISLGYLDRSGKLLAEVWTPNRHTDVQMVGTFQPGHLYLESAQCPNNDRQAQDAILFDGELKRGNDADLNTAIRSLPALSAVDDQAASQQRQRLLGEWVGPVALWISDYSGQPATPDGVMRLRITPGDSSETFHASAEVRHAWGYTVTADLPAVNLRDGAFEATGTGNVVGDADELDIFAHGQVGLQAVLQGDHLTIQQGALMRTEVAGQLQPGTDADFNRLVRTLPHLKLGQYPPGTTLIAH